MERVDEYFKEKKDMISDFNEAKLQIFRLNNCWERCQTFVRVGELDKWKWELDIIWRELATDAKKMDKNREGNEKYGLKVKILNELITKHQTNNTKLYKILEKKEEVLRDLQDDAGKGSKRSYGEEDDIEG